MHACIYACMCHKPLLLGAVISFESVTDLDLHMHACIYACMCHKPFLLAVIIGFESVADLDLRMHACMYVYMYVCAMSLSPLEQWEVSKAPHMLI